jgi:hypothetical protein
MAVSLSPFAGAGAQFFDNNGVILSGGKIYTYAAGSTVPLASYTSVSGATPHSNPIVLDSAGRVPGGEIWLLDGTRYKFVVETSTGILIGSYDNINQISSSSASVANYIGDGVTTVFGIGDTPPTKLATDVYINGVYQNKNTYDVSGADIVFTQAPPLNSLIEIVTQQSSVITATSAGSVSYTPRFTGAVTSTVQDKLEEVVSVEDFGAVGDGVTDDLPAFQAAVDYLLSTASKFRGGTVTYGRGRYLLNGTLQINGSGITLKGPTIPERSVSNVQSNLTAGALIGGATTGPVIAVRAGDTVLENVFVTSTSERRAAAISRASLTSNNGISIELPDSSGAIGANVIFNNVMVRNQPAEGVYMAGHWVNVTLENLVCIANGGHGLAIDNGTLVGRANLFRPGIINIINYRAFDNGGHSYAVGHPSDGAEIPYRVYILNSETFRNGLSESQRYIDAGSFLRAENALVQVSANGGTGVGNTPSRATIAISGRQVVLDTCRYINGTQNVLLKNYAGITTRLVSFRGGWVSSDTPATNFIETDTGCAQITVEDVAGDFTVYISNNNLSGLIIKNSLTAANGFEYSFRASDFNYNSSAKVRNIRPHETDNAFNLTGDEAVRIGGLVGSTQVSGMLRVSQNSGSTGDASIRCDVGSNQWIFGTRRSANTFSLRNSNTFSNSGNIINVLSDGGTNGFVGFGPNTTAPAHRVDVNGSVNVRTGGAFRFNGTQVVGARQIDAALANTPNSGDANTDALITALKNVIIAHGLGAAS